MSGSRQKSAVWNHFVKDDIYTVCKICSDKLVCYNTTTNMLNHLRAKHPEVMLPKPTVSIKNFAITASKIEKYDHAVAVYIATNAQPLNLC